MSHIQALKSAGTIHLGDLQKQGNRIELSVQYGTQTHPIFFESDDFDLVPNREAKIAFALCSCMVTGSPLEVNGSISVRLLDAIPHIQDVFSCWYPHYQHIQLASVLPKTANKQGTRGRTALFFSGGLDCWYSLIKHKEEITDLIFIWGYDIPLENTCLFEKTLSSQQKVARGMDKHLIVIRTNMRSFTDQFVRWNNIFGTGLAGIAHLLSPEIGKIYLAGGQSYKRIWPAGSHLLVDPYWSSEDIEIIYDAAELSRVEKARVVGENDLAMQTLRVCWANPDNDYNCGRCEKCLRTMVNLQVAGALERCTTFAVPLSLERISKLTFFDQGDLNYLEENTRTAQKQPHNRKLFRALRRALNRFSLLHFLRRIRGNYPTLFPNMNRIKKSLRRVRFK